ncbi:MAG: hypothetical protein M3068_11035 [Gemmatimonadota bacterium]|nr:hypothetical protein [Gemmatimonadota bacterium]
MRQVTARAPTRIDFGGGWTDVPPYPSEQGGCVCNIAISRYASVRLSTGAAGLDRADDGDGALPAAALRHARLDGVSIALDSDFPVGAGLGGSSAAGVAIAAAIARWRGESLERTALAERSREVEVEELGIAGGRQDHYAAAFGGALGLWFGESVTVRQLDLDSDVLARLERRCVVGYTGRSRLSGETITAVLDAYRDREPRVTGALARMRTLAQEMIMALELGSLDDLGALVDEHWEHQRSLHPTIETPEIERVLALARQSGGIGGKALGASGGGCVLVIAGEGREHDVRDSVAATSQLLPFSIDSDGVWCAADETAA